jgi:hypothetical protein
MPVPAIPIDAKARGKLWVWKAAAAENWRRVEARCESREFQTAIRDLASRGSRTGPGRAFAKLHRGFAGHGLLEGVRLDGTAPLAVWSVLNPRKAVTVNTDDPALQQNCVVVEYLLAGPLPAGMPTNACTGLWTLEVPDHALGRLSKTSLPPCPSKKRARDSHDLVQA